MKLTLDWKQAVGFIGGFIRRVYAIKPDWFRAYVPLHLNPGSDKGSPTFWCLSPRICAAYVSAPVHATSQSWQCNCTLPAWDSVDVTVVVTDVLASEDVDATVVVFSDASFLLCRCPSKCSLYVFMQHSHNTTVTASSNCQRRMNKYNTVTIYSHYVMTDSTILSDTWTSWLNDNS